MGREGHTAESAPVCGGAVLQGSSKDGLEPQSRGGQRCFPPGVSTLFQHVPELWPHSGPEWTVLVEGSGAGHLLPLQGEGSSAAKYNGREPLS